MTASHISGTVAVASGATTVTGVGSTWKSSDIRPGDRFVALGLTVGILSVTNNTTLELANPWPGAALAAGSAYEIMFVDDGVRGIAHLNDVFTKITLTEDYSDEAAASAAAAAASLAAITPMMDDVEALQVLVQTTVDSFDDTVADITLKAENAATSETNSVAAAEAAEASALAAATSAEGIDGIVTAAEAARDIAVTKAGEADASAIAAAGSVAAIAGHASDANLARLDAVAAKEDAEAAATFTGTKAGEANASAVAAAQSETDAEAHKNTALQAVTDATAQVTLAQGHATTATTKAGEASTSADAAAQALLDAQTLVSELEGGPVISIAGLTDVVTLAQLEGAGVALTASTATAAQGAKADTAVQPGDTHAAAVKATPVDADEMSLFDSAASWVRKKFTFGNLKTTLKTYFDTVYQPTSAQLTLLASTLSRADGNFLVGDGTNWVVESGATARASLGLGSVATATLSTDGTLAGNSDTVVSSQKAVKTYVDGLIAANDAMVFKGVIDCSTNPNYPAADRGWTYRVSVAGKIGGASGVNVEAGDILLCLTDGTAAGTHAAVGANWGAIQLNIDGALTTANIGVSVQAYDGDLNAIAGLTYTANDMVYWTGSGAVAKQASTAYGRGFLNLADAAAGRTLLALGTMATQASSNYAALTGAAFTGSVSISGTATGLTIAGTSNNWIELGSIAGVATTPFIDFHSGATAVDYDSRIIASGGNGASGGGTLDITSAILRWNGYSLLDNGTAQTIGGAKTFSATPTFTSGAITIKAGAPRTIYEDTDNAGAGKFWWTYLDGDVFYVLRDSGADGVWDAPHPLQLNGAAQTGLIFGNQVLTANSPVMTTPTINNGYIEETQNITSGTTAGVDLALGTRLNVTLTGNWTPGSWPTPVAGMGFSGMFRQDGTGGRLITWPASVKFPGGVAPTLTTTANKGDKIVFECFDGSTWTATVAGLNF